MQINAQMEYCGEHHTGEELGCCGGHVATDLKNRIARVGDGRFYCRPTNANALLPWPPITPKVQHANLFTWQWYAVYSVTIVCTMLAKRINRIVSIYLLFLCISCRSACHVAQRWSLAKNWPFSKWIPFGCTDCVVVCAQTIRRPFGAINFYRQIRKAPKRWKITSLLAMTVDRTLESRWIIHRCRFAWHSFVSRV